MPILVTEAGLIPAFAHKSFFFILWARLDLAEVEEINCLVVLVKWSKGELDHETILNERIVRELLESLKLA